MALDDLLLKPLPREAHPGPSALEYHSIAVDTHNPLYSEQLVDVAEYGIAGENYYTRKDRLNAPYYSCVCSGSSKIYLRKNVAEKLTRINSLLKPHGVELYLFDGYRPLACQQALWKYFLEVARKQLGTNDPVKLRRFAGRYSSEPGGFDVHKSTTWPTHITGGAVDLTLRRLGTGELLFMGGIFDDASAISHVDAFERKFIESASQEAARRNRRLLYWAMRSEGFANYAYEWWHFDFGNQMWVQNSRRLPNAAKVGVYGPASLP